jgi:hypothetical protein
MGCMRPSGMGGPGEYRQTFACRLLCGAAPSDKERATHECMALVHLMSRRTYCSAMSMMMPVAMATSRYSLFARIQW